jgi:hypothetical protein
LDGRNGHPSEGILWRNNGEIKEKKNGLDLYPGVGEGEVFSAAAVQVNRYQLTQAESIGQLRDGDNILIYRDVLQNRSVLGVKYTIVSRTVGFLYFAWFCKQVNP